MWYDEYELRETIKEERRGLYEWYKAIEPQIISYEQHVEVKKKRKKRRAPRSM